MKRQFRNFIIGLLVVVLSMTVTACTDSSGKQGSKEKTSDVAVMETVPDDSGDVVKLTVWAILSPEIEDYATNYQSQWYEDYSGIKIHWINVPMHGWADAFQLSVMNGEYPDIYLYDFSASEVEICAEYGAIIPLNDLIDKNCPNIKKYLDSRTDIKNAITSPDGNIYTLFTESYNISSYTQKLWVNQEWLMHYTEATGNGMPENINEFEQMLLFFKDNDMNGNGDATDEIPYMGCSGVEGIYALIGAFVPSNSSRNAYGCIVDNDGNVNFYYNTLEFREALKYLNRLYRENLISDQTFTININDRYNYTSNGQENVKVGVVSAVNISDIVQLGNSEMDYSSYIAIPPMEGPEGVRTAVTAGETTLNLRNAVTSSCKYPDEAVRWLDYWYSEEGRLWSVNGGLEGVHWSYANGKAATGGDKVVVHANDVDIYNNFCWSGKGVAYMPCKDDFAYMDRNSLGKNASLATFLANEEYSQYSILSGWPSIVWTTDEMSGYATEYSELVNLIENYITQYYTEFIIGKRNIDDDAQWESYINGLDELGLERYVELIGLYANGK